MGLVGALLSFLFLLFPLRHDVKYYVFPLEPEDDAEDLVAVVDSNDKDDDGEAREVKGLLMISYI